MTTINNNFKVKNGLDVAEDLSVSGSANITNTVTVATLYFSGDDTFVTSASGLQGYTGSAGTNGNNGSTGYTGSKGDAGNNGNDGATGYTGSTGEAGYQGSAGLGFDPLNSTDTVTVSTGSKSFTVDRTATLDTAFSAGNVVWINASGYLGAMKGTVISFSDNSITVNVTGVLPSANGQSFSLWTITLNGATGLQGYTGSKGNTGDTGFTGSQGIIGITGYVGSKGDVGYTGSQGVQGEAGNNGNDGATGFTGSKGDKGDTGFTGSKGDTGFVGSKGDKGDTGFTGSQGTTGYVGSRGTDGNSDKYSTVSSSNFTLGLSSGSITVETGLSWTTGQTAVIAYDASNLAYVTVTGYNSGTGVFDFTVDRTVGVGLQSAWTVNLDGAVGVLGYTGSQGSTGYVGSKGDLGYTGSAGTNGTNGTNGNDGATGYTGSKGLTGDQGGLGYTGSASTVAGATGYTGSAGSYNQSLNTTDSPSFVKVTLGGTTSDSVYDIISADGIVHSSYFKSGISGTSGVNLDTFDGSAFGTAKYVIQVRDGSSVHATEILLVQDGTNIHLTEFGQLSTGSLLGTFSAANSSGTIVLQFTPTGATSMIIRVSKVKFAL